MATQTPADAGYNVLQFTKDELVVADKNDCKRELFMRAPGSLPGWGLRFNGEDWEFVRSVPDDFTLDD